MRRDPEGDRNIGNREADGGRERGVGDRYVYEKGKLGEAAYETRCWNRLGVRWL